MERVGEVARAVAERSWDLVGRGFLGGLMASPSESSSGSESEELKASSMLSLSLSLPSSWCSSVSSSGNACSSSSRCLFSLSTSTLNPRPPSSASSWTLSHTLFRSIVRGTLLRRRSSRSFGFFASSFFAAKALCSARGIASLLLLDVQLLSLELVSCLEGECGLLGELYAF